jgi:transglutaminase-like putative cysteine protease
MRIAVTHSTQYRYDAPVVQEPHTFRFRPRTDAAQRLLHFQLQILPIPAGQSECLDREGNVVLEAWFDAPMTELAVQSSFEVETVRENPFDFLLTGTGRLPLDADDAMAAYLTPPGDIIQAFAGRISRDAGDSAMPFLNALNGELFERFGHETRDDGPAHSPERTLEERSGTCRDLAVLFCASCRAMRIPARFVSGYALGSESEDRADLHAWAEVYLPGGGWRGYDPSQGLGVGTSHVAVAAAADPAMAAPVSGNYRGSASATMQYALSVVPVL